MRLITFKHDGGLRTGVIEGDTLTDLTFANGAVPHTIDDIIREGATARVAEWVARAPAEARRPVSSVTPALPLASPGKIVCLGLNYADHAAEGGHATPTYPALFLRTLSSLVAANEPMVRPLCSERFDFEAELMLIVGKRGRHLSESNALDVVFGYTLFNDGSVRDYQRKTTQWTAGKNFDGTGAVGPSVITADELPPGATGLGIRCILNGETMQSSRTDKMVFDVKQTLIILSEIMTLEPGDMIAMGTPDGVGNARKPPIYMKPGDIVVVEIDRVGRLENPVTAELAA